MEEVPFVPRPPKFLLTRVGELTYTEPVYLIAELVEAGCLALLFGDPGCGKSFVGVDISLCVATGTPFHGRKVDAGPVIYLAGEGHNGLRRRVAAWEKDRNVNIGNCPLFLSATAAQFLDHAMMEEVQAAVDQATENCGPPKLIVVDTVARSFAGGDENSTADMTKFVAAVDALRVRYNCTILLIHHTGHGEKKRARGNMALKGALDAEYRAEQVVGGLRIECTKMKDAPQPANLHFSLNSVVIGTAQDGKDITSAVLRETVSFDQDAPKKLTANQQLGLDTYTEAVQQNGTLRDDGGFAGLHVDAWRDEFYRKHTGEKTDTKKTAFQRARRDLVDNGFLRVDGFLYFPAGPFSAIDEARFVDMIQKRDTGQ